MSQVLSLKDFHYDLPEDLIAQEPLADRAASRLLQFQPSSGVSHHMIRDLPNILPEGTHLVINDTRVIPGRLLGHTQHGGKIELMLLRPKEGVEGNVWTALGKPFKKMGLGTQLFFANDCVAEVVAREEHGSQPSLTVRFNKSVEDFWAWMEDEGFVPLPPYIQRKNPATAQHSEDKSRYQTIYANEKGSVAAPTAGLHFSKDLWDALLARGITPVPVTLHVGGGTFLPVKSNEIASHVMHKESFRVTSESYNKLTKAMETGAPIVAVGTTSLRCLESFARLAASTGAEHCLDRWHETELFIYPENENSLTKPWAIQGIITNFHQPESSLLMLVSALIGYHSIQSIYAEAIRERYRFFSYGDASLLWLP